jgi:hypothetical protein
MADFRDPERSGLSGREHRKREKRPFAALHERNSGMREVGDSVARLPQAPGIRSVARSVQPRFLAL